ncbi:MAG: AAA family ATPase [Chloroflexi bacterium]|nr:AAA family ATPase [Chloroflexota bacterium]
MARLAKAEEAGIYAAAQQWVDRALCTDDSLFTPGEPVWSLENIDDFLERVDSESVGQGTFIGRYEDCLAPAPHNTIQLGAEILYVHFLINDAIGGGAKRDQIMTVLGWADRDSPLPQNLDGALDGGVCNPGPYFATRRHLQLRRIAMITKSFKQQPEDQRIAAIDDPWRSKQAVWNDDDLQTYIQTSAILHLVFPDSFERVLPKYHKEQIARAFVDRIDTESDDLDRNLLQIRDRLSETYGEHLDFYDDQIWTQWGSRGSDDTSKWGMFIRWSRRFVDHPDFDEEERDFKLEIADNLQAARSAVEADSDDWVGTLRRAFGNPNNLTSWQVHDRFLTWCGEHRTEARTALLNLWRGESAIEAAVRVFLNCVPARVDSTPGGRANLAAFLAMAADPSAYPPYRVTVLKSGYDLTGYPVPDNDSDEAAVYRHALDFFDMFIREASQRGLDLRDRLDAQSALWAVATSGWFKEVLPEEEHEAFLSYREGGTGPKPPPARTLQGIADKLRWHVSHLEEISKLLDDKRQVVFYGPPGTGKTYVAQELAECFAGEHGSVDLVQFHPSYAYEDFIEGFRPALVDDQPGFELKDGPLKRIADRARIEPNTKHVLVIDEINRGNLAKVFGELYFLLEYRDREISLQYADQPFTLPQNLWIIATMNTADRSIALVDAALRRRFFFVPFFPDEPPVEGLLRRWLLEKKPTMLWVADVVDAANKILDDLEMRDMAIGPSYFMNDKLDEEWAERIWRHSILPYVEEQLFGQTERIGEFKLNNLRAAVQRSTGAEEEAATANGQADAAPEPGDA